MTSLLTKEEQEELLNQKIEMMKKKNAELMKRHQLVEEDKRLAEQQGRSVTIRNPQAPYSPMKGEILRAAEEDGKRKAVQNNRNQSVKKPNGPNIKLQMGKAENSDSGPPPDPACKFLADRRREGPLPSRGRGREFSRRHPRNFGGIDFSDVPKKIHDEKERQTYQPQIRTKADETLYTTGKERRELAEWRREREKIDRERLERQRNKEGNWKREWDQDKNELSYADEVDDQDQPMYSKPPQSMPRLDDRFRANGRGRPQRKKDGQNEPDSATSRQVTNRTLNHTSGLARPQGLSDEATHHPREEPERLLSVEISLHQTIDQKPGNEGRRFRRVQQQNDSLVIKVEAQPSDFSRVPSNSVMNFVEPAYPDSAPRNRPKNGRRNVREGRPVGRLSSSSDSFCGLEKTDVPDLRKGEEPAFESIPSRTYKSDVIVERAASSRNTDIACRGEILESSLGSPRQMQSDLRAEKHVGSGRISVHGKKRRNKHRKKRDGEVNREQYLDDDPGSASGLTAVTKNFEKKIPTEAECEAKTQKTGTRDRVIANQAERRPPISHSGVQVRVDSDTTCDSKQAEVKNRNSELAVDKCLHRDAEGKPDLLGKSFDLDQDPPEGDEFDDEEWEDIDEEVCIDLIAGGEEESYEEGPLDISDDTLDQLVSAHIIPPRGQTVVDWAAEMESAEVDSAAAAARNPATSGLVPKSLANESP